MPKQCLIFGRILICHRYIEQNSVRAGMVDDPAVYPWSGYSANALGRSNSLLTPHALLMSLGSDANSRCQAYRELFSESLPESVLEEIRYDNKKCLPLGGAQFKAQVEAKLRIKLGTRQYPLQNGLHSQLLRSRSTSQVSGHFLRRKPGRDTGGIDGKGQSTHVTRCLLGWVSQFFGFQIGVFFGKRKS